MKPDLNRSSLFLLLSTPSLCNIIPSIHLSVHSFFFLPACLFVLSFSPSVCLPTVYSSYCTITCSFVLSFSPSIYLSTGFLSLPSAHKSLTSIVTKCCSIHLFFFFIVPSFCVYVLLSVFSSSIFLHNSTSRFLTLENFLFVIAYVLQSIQITLAL